MSEPSGRHVTRSRSRRRDRRSTSVGPVTHHRPWLVGRLRQSAIGRLVTSALRHQRSVRALRRSGLFDEAHYRSQVIGELRGDPAVHYLKHGSQQGLSPHPLFDRDHYLATNPTVARSSFDPFVQFVRVGARRGRSPHPLFDVDAYLEVAPASADHDQGPFGHFMSTPGAPFPLPRPIRELLSGLQGGSYSDLSHAAVSRYAQDPDYTHFTRSFLTFDHDQAAQFVREVREFAATLGDPPLVSVILPTKDRREQLGVAITSVQEQTYAHWELIVVDDGGSDGSDALVAKFIETDPRIRYVAQENTGVSGARNHGIRLSSGHFLAYLDSDNTWVPEFLEVMVGFLVREKLGAAYSASELRGKDQLEYRGQPMNIEALRERNFVDCICLVHERSLLSDVGPFDDRLRRMVDWDLLIRLGSVVDLVYAPFVGTSYDAWDESGARITKTESAGYRFVVIDKHRVRWDEAPAISSGRTSVVLTSQVPPSALYGLVASLQEARSAVDDDFEVLIVDHCYDRADGLMLRLVEQVEPCVKVIRLVDSPSVAVARNTAAAVATGDVVVFCDGVEPTLLDVLALRDSCRSQEAIVQPVVVDDAGVVVSAGIGLAGRGHLVRWFLGHLADDPELAGAAVDAVEGWMMAVDAQLLRRLEGFDALFIDGSGDVDLCLRARDLGVLSRVDCATVVPVARDVDRQMWSPGPPDRIEFQRLWGARGWSCERIRVRERVAALEEVVGERAGNPARWQPVLHPSRQRRWAIRTCVPGLAVARTWGDWHFAQGLKVALEELGELVSVDTALSTTRRSCYLDHINVMLRGISRQTVNPAQTNFLWVISHPERVTREEVEDYDWVFVASPTFAEQMRDDWGYDHVEPLLQCTDPSRFFPDPDSHLHEPLLFVGNSRRVRRPVLADAIAAGYRPAVYGSDWDGMLPPELVRGTYLPNEELRRHYSSAGVVLNDHWEDMRTFGILSNRLFDAVAAGAVVVSDHVAGVEAVFGDRVVTYQTVEDLPAAIERAKRLQHGDGDIPRSIRQEHSFLARAQCLVARATAESGMAELPPTVSDIHPSKAESRAADSGGSQRPDPLDGGSGQWV